MSIYGMSVRDANEVETLGMSDFTLSKLAQVIIPASNSTDQGLRSDYIELDVPGYDPATCFVTIVPRVYAQYEQPGYFDGWGCVPVYRDLGGTKIAIYTYTNRRFATGVGGNYRDEWISAVVESVVEVVKVM
ncbi:hypothetical protein UB48_04560 [Pseudomonas sp. 2(2015)]|nr:hypothetical protein UB48_04560 [Pseudomonas sp. 2(2015)]